MDREHDSCEKPTADACRLRPAYPLAFAKKQKRPKVRCLKLNYLKLAIAPSQRRFALAHIIVCCGASIVAHFARKVRATNT